MTRPGEVLGEELGLVAGHESLQARQMLLIEPARAADGEPHPMQRERIAHSHRLEGAMRRPAVAHIVLGMHLEPADVGLALEDVAVMLGLEPNPRPWRYRAVGKATG